MIACFLRRLVLLSLSIGLLVPTLALSQAQTLMMFEGESKVLDLAPIERVAIGNSELAATTILASGELVLTADKVGETNIQLWFRDGRRGTISLIVSASNSDREIEEIKQLLSGVADLRIQRVGSQVVVDGNVLERDLERINLVKARYPNMLVLAQQISEFGQKMIYFDVKVMEFNKQDMEELGIRWDTNTSGPGFRFTKGVNTNPFFRGSGEGDPLAGAVGLPPPDLQGIDQRALQRSSQVFFGIASEIKSRISFMESSGSAITLASPRLSARSGGKAELTVGGQVPVVSTSINGSNVTYKDFGVLLQIEPKLDPYGNLVASVKTEVSQLDKANQVQEFPAFRTRKTSNDVVMKSGETLVLSGLITNEDQKTQDQVKGLGDIPVLGALFRSKGFTKGKTELVVFITPEVIEDLEQGIHKDELMRGQKILDRLKEQVISEIKE